MQFVLMVITLFGAAPVLDALPTPPAPPPAVLCTLDGYEPNDTRRQARLIDGSAKGRLCVDDVDWLAFDAEAGQRVEVQLTGAARGQIFAPRRRRARLRVGPKARRFTVRHTGRHKVRVDRGRGPYTFRAQIVR